MVVDHFSKYTHFLALVHPYSATTVAKAFFDTIVRLHGVSESIASDRDLVITSMLWKDLFRLTGTKLCTSLTFHPEIDDQSEVTNKIITIYLHCLAGDRVRSWLRWLPWEEFCFNFFYQTAFHVPSPLFPYQSGMARVVAVEQQLCDCDEFLVEVKERLLQSQALMKQTCDKKHRNIEFTVSE
jgi:hypothetical protein